MSVGEDIKQAYIEVGIGYTIIRNTSTLSGKEYLIYETRVEASKPFVREFLLEASLPFDTKAKSGDILRLDTNVDFLVTAHTPDMLEGVPIEFQTSLYKVNVSGELLRLDSETVDSDYRTLLQWSTVRQQAFGTLVPTGFSKELNEDFIAANEDSLEMFTPSCYEVKEQDRYSPTSGEYYRVKTINRRRFAGIDHLILDRDMR